MTAEAQFVPADSTVRSLNVGDSTVFTTRVVGQGPTMLYAFAPDTEGSMISWHIELCCHPTNNLIVDPNAQVDIGAAGALVTVTNVGNLEIGNGRIVVQTDYI